MWYVYVIESLKNGIWYKGYTDDLKQRFDEHNRKSGGKTTRNNGPFKLIYYEAYLEKTDAAKTEKFYKTGYGREILKDKLENYIKKKKK